MILATLLLILAVLLFGAGVVKGFLANAAALGCGGIVIIGLAIWVGSFLGQNGLLYIFFGGAALLIAFAIFDRVHTAALNYTPPPLPREKKFHGSTPTQEERKRIKANMRKSETYSIQDPSYDNPDA